MDTEVGVTGNAQRDDAVDDARVRSVVIIGAGITGCSAAYYLSEFGSDIEVIDSGGLGEQSTTQTAGNLHFQLSYHAMKGTEEEFAHHTLIRELNDESDRLWSELAATLSPHMEVTQRGGIVVAESERDLEVLKRKVEMERAAGFETVYLEGAALREKVPELAERVIGGSWHAREGHVNARVVCYELARVAQERGVAFRLDTHVTALRRQSGHWSVTTASGDRIRAQHVVIAAGAWTTRVAALADVTIPVDVYGLNMGITEKCTRRMTNLVMHASRPLSIKQMADGNIMIGGGRPASVRLTDTALSYRAEPLPTSILAGLDDVARVIPAAQGLRLLRSWQGLLATPIDELPIIGPVPGCTDLFVSVAGHTGFTLGPSCGRIVAQLIAGRRPDVAIDHFAPDRFGTIDANVPHARVEGAVSNG